MNCDEILSFLSGLPYQDEEDLKEKISNFLEDRFVPEIVPLHVDIDYNPTNRSVAIDGVYLFVQRRRKLELKETVDLMLSDDYKERLLAEIQQLAIRGNKLSKLIDENIDIETAVDPKIAADPGFFLYVIQMRRMLDYFDVLKKRCLKEGIEIDFSLIPPKCMADE